MIVDTHGLWLDDIEIYFEINPGDTTEEFDSFIEKNTIHSKNIESFFPHFWGKHSKNFIKVRPGAKKYFFQISELYNRFLIILWNTYVKVNYMAYIKKLISINLFFSCSISNIFLFSKKWMGSALVLIKL